MPQYRSPGSAPQFSHGSRANIVTNGQLASEVEEITKSHPMEYLCNHPFFMVRWIENNRRELLVDAIDPKPGEVVADIGCERGHLLSMLHQRCPELRRVYGADLSRHALQEARTVAEWEGWAAKAQFVHCDARSVILPDNSADVVISSNVLDHLPDPQEGFDELVRIVKPGGRIILNLPNEKRIVAAKRTLLRLGLQRLMGNLKLVTPGHLHYPDRQFVRDLVAGKARIRRMFLGPKISLVGLCVYAILEPTK
ncbi:MAG: class I SAM-dependent methyltransferase [Candidatus Sericytochromatia bacterium]|uniref:Class I SAM-dependent methyltransferase n=1 Tax=Candidatus Tanganyikabacteria bacterium TaxID=2961651 RepID=A0A937X6S4_9BACT|nr:class I SAM-dependent methyltransferase [Candidatus Tanganyikabacteria bacterium]